MMTVFLFLLSTLAASVLLSPNAKRCSAYTYAACRTHKKLAGDAPRPDRLGLTSCLLDRPHPRPPSSLFAINGEGSSNGGSTYTAQPEDFFDHHAEFYEFVLVEHKPLGCTVEESLAEELNGAKHVFVSSVTKNGNAEKAGIIEGDVIVGLSGAFDAVANVCGLGLDRVRALVNGRLSNDPLVIRVARGTDVKDKHESALIDLCTITEGTDKALEECLASLYGVELELDEIEESDVCGDGETECMLETMWTEWDEESWPLHQDEQKVESDIVSNEEGTKSKSKTAPWSSRSSFSGTFVRDPTTGEMRNIDEQ